MTSYSDAVEEAKALARWSKDEGFAPLAIQVGDVRMELAVIPQAPGRITPPTRQDATKLYEEMGGKPLAELLAEDDSDLESVQ